MPINASLGALTAAGEAVAGLGGVDGQSTWPAWRALLQQEEEGGDSDAAWPSAEWLAQSSRHVLLEYDLDYSPPAALQSGAQRTPAMLWVDAEGGRLFKWLGGEVCACKSCGGCAVPSSGAYARDKACGGAGCLHEVMGDPGEVSPLCTKTGCVGRTLGGVATSAAEAAELRSAMRSALDATPRYPLWRTGAAAQQQLDSLDAAVNSADTCDVDWEEYAAEHGRVLQPLEGIVGSLPAPPPPDPPAPPMPPWEAGGEACAAHAEGPGDAAWCSICTACSGYCPGC